METSCCGLTTKNISRWAWKRQQSNEECARDDAEMCVSEAKSERYQHRRLELFSFLSSRSSLFSRPPSIGSFSRDQSFCAQRCQSESMSCKNSTNTIGSDHLKLDFQHFYSPTFFLLSQLEMKVNICSSDSDRVECTANVPSFVCRLVWAKKVFAPAPCGRSRCGANQRMSIWIMRRMNCQFHVRRQFVHWQFMGFFSV